MAKGCNTAGDHYLFRTINPLRVDITQVNHNKTIIEWSPTDTNLIKMSPKVILISKACRAAIAPNVFLKA